MSDHRPRERFRPPGLRRGSGRDRHIDEPTLPGVRFPIVDDLAMIAADDRMLDLIELGDADLAEAPRESRALTDGDEPPVFGEGSLGPLLAAWRSEIVDPPLPELPTVVYPKRTMRAPANRPPGRALRPILVAAVAIFALVVGSAAVGAHSAQPGDALWPLTKVLYSSHAESVAAKYTVTDMMNRARSLLNEHQTSSALGFLKSASKTIRQVDPSDGLEQLQTELNVLVTRANSSTAAGLPSVAALAGTLGAVASHSAGPNTTTSPNAKTGTTTSVPHSPASPGAPVIGPLPGSGTTPDGSATDPVIEWPVDPDTTEPVVPPVIPDPATSADPVTTPDPGTTADPVTTPDPPTTVDPPTTPDPPTTADPPTTPDPPTTVDPPTTPAPATTPDPPTTADPATTPDPGTSSDSDTNLPTGDPTVGSSTDVPATSQLPVPTPSDTVGGAAPVTASTPAGP